MTSIAHDLRYAVRGLLKGRGFAAVAILTLAIALGANTAIYSIFSAILLRPLPFAEPEQLVSVKGAGAQHPDLAFSLPSYTDVSTQAKSFEQMAGYRPSDNFLYGGSEPERISGARVTANLFPLLRAKAHLGRTFTEREDMSGQASLIVISYELWQRRFAGDPGIIGKQIRLGTDPDTVVGVMPRGFRFPIESTEPTDFLIPLRQEPLSEARGAGWIQAVARLRDGVSIEQANAELKTIAARMAVQFPSNYTGVVFSATPLHDMIVSGVRPALLVLLAAVGVVLLIGCANVANLLLARAAARHREISIRAAIGATRARIVSQLLVESVLLSLVAGALGLLLAAWGVDALVALAPPETPRLDAVALDGHVLLFALLLSVGTGILFGLAPALSASKTNLVEALKEGGRGSTEGHRRNRIRNALVVAEIALSVILLVGAGLLLRSFVRLSGIDPGYDYRNAMSVEVSIRPAVFPTPEARVQYYRRALDELRSIPGVTAVGGATHLPLSDATSLSFSIVGRPPSPPGQGPNGMIVWVSPSYFETMGMPVLRGRSFTDRDTGNAPNGIIVSESLARQNFPNEDPIGKQLDLGIPPEDAGGIRTIVGVVRDIRFASLTEAPSPTMYVPILQGPMPWFQFVVRAPNAADLGPSMRAALRRVDREQPILAVRTLEEMRAASLGSRRFMLVLVGLLATLALILAAVGIYSIMSYTVTQRTSEIGIRMALGAEARDVFRLVMGQSIRFVVLGALIGIAVALAATRTMQSLLYGIAPTDPWTFSAIVAIIAGTALVASWIPASRAARVDPLVAIRYD